jgi:hypothetical protein
MTTLEFPGVTQQLYDQVGAHLPKGPPDGILYHACGPVAGGWRIAEIWESAAALTDSLTASSFRRCERKAAQLIRGARCLRLITPDGFSDSSRANHALSLIHVES